MKEAIAKVKGALAAKDFGAAMNYYTFKDDFIYASDGNMTAATPYAHGLDRLVPGAELEALLARLPNDVTCMYDDASITMKGGRLRGTIKTQSTVDRVLLVPEHPWNEPPHGLVEAMRRARPFIADVAAQPYATCMCFRKDALFATTNMSLVQVQVPGLAPGDLDLLLPSWAVDFVLKAYGTLNGIIFTPNYMAFRWDDGSWLRTKLIEGAFPATVVTLLSNVEPEQPFELGPGWRLAYADVAALSEGIVGVEASRITGGKGHSKVEADVEPTGIEAPVHFNPRFLTAVIDVATHWNPAEFPRPVPFVGPGLRGLVVGRRA